MVCITSGDSGHNNPLLFSCENFYNEIGIFWTLGLIAEWLWTCTLREKVICMAKPVCILLCILFIHVLSLGKKRPVAHKFQGYNSR
jgi:hypothetical protein